MTNSEYEEILRDATKGVKQIHCQMAGAKDLFIRLSPSLFKAQTGCSVWLSCFITRFVVYFLDPIMVAISITAAISWIGSYGFMLVLPSIFLWGGCKAYFANRLPFGPLVMIASFTLCLIGPIFFFSVAANVYFIALGIILFQNYLLYAIPLSDAIKCSWQSKAAFEIFYDLSKGTPSPIIVILETKEYIDIATQSKLNNN
jgi:hypothetical protein